MHQIVEAVDALVRVLDAAERGKKFIRALLGHGDLAVEKALCVGIVHHDGNVVRRQLDVDLGAVEVIFRGGNDRSDSVFGKLAVIRKSLMRQEIAAAEIRPLGEGREEGIRARNVVGYNTVDSACRKRTERALRNNVNESLLERMDRICGRDGGVKNDRSRAV